MDGEANLCTVVMQVPMIGGTGNHEEEQEADGSIFKSVQARWPVGSSSCIFS
jgi:hypothetical protein